MERGLYLRYEVLSSTIIFHGVLYHPLDNFKIRRNEWNVDAFSRCNPVLVWSMLKIESCSLYMLCSVEVGGKGSPIVPIWGL